MKNFSFNDVKWATCSHTGKECSQVGSNSCEACESNPDSKKED